MHKMKLVSFYNDYGNKDLWDDTSPVKAVCDRFIFDNVREGKQVAMLIEPRSVMPDVYEKILEVYDQYEYVFTGDDYLLKTLPNAKRILWGTVWYRCENPEKDKLMCIISSDKEYCDLHKERKRIARKYKDRIDVYGTIDGGTYLDDNIHKSYKYEIAIENDIEDEWFTEKLLNCFANKVVPIYYGARDISKFFNMDGIIECKSIAQLENKVDCFLNNTDEANEVYNSEIVQKAMEENYELSKQFENFDNWFYKTYEKEIEGLFV